MRALLLALTLIALAGCENLPIRPTNGDDYYNTRTTGGVRGTLGPPTGIPQTIVIPTP